MEEIKTIDRIKEIILECQRGMSTRDHWPLVMQQGMIIEINKEATQTPIKAFTYGVT